LEAIVRSRGPPEDFMVKERGGRDICWQVQSKQLTSCWCKTVSESQPHSLLLGSKTVIKTGKEPLRKRSQHVASGLSEPSEKRTKGGELMSQEGHRESGRTTVPAPWTFAPVHDKNPHASARGARKQVKVTACPASPSIWKKIEDAASRHEGKGKCPQNRTWTICTSNSK